MKVKALVYVLAALALGACNKFEWAAGLKAPVSVADGHRIVGGVQVESDEPIAARTALLINKGFESFCSASILNEEWIVTAAHCVVDVPPYEFFVAFTGSYHDYAWGLYQDDVREVEAIHVHPAYHETLAKLSAIYLKFIETGNMPSDEEFDALRNYGDIALVRIKGKIPSSKIPATLLDPSISLEQGQAVVLAGYGRTEPDAEDGGVLRKVTVTIADPNWSATEVLLHNSGAGACFGDSGGPAYVYARGQYYLFGVTSRGVKGQDCGYFTAYTNLLSYLDWINSLMSK